MKIFFQVAFERGTVITSIKAALFVGTILALINYGDRIFLQYDMLALDWIKLGITYSVPYCVSTYGAAMFAKRHFNGKKSDTIKALPKR